MGLFTPAWMSGNITKAQKAVDNESNQIKLDEIARNAPLETTRIGAVKKLIDQSVLANHAKGQNANVAIAAVMKLTDISILVDIVNTASVTGARITAVRRLNNQAMLTDIAMNNNYKDVRDEALTMLVDKTLVEKIKSDAAMDEQKTKKPEKKRNKNTWKYATNLSLDEINKRAKELNSQNKR